MPSRSWCEACVSGRGIGDQHRSGPESQVPTISFAYLLVTKKGIKLKGQAGPENVFLKILVVKDLHEQDDQCTCREKQGH